MGSPGIRPHPWGTVGFFTSLSAWSLDEGYLDRAPTWIPRLLNFTTGQNRPRTRPEFQCDRSRMSPKCPADVPHLSAEITIFARTGQFNHAHNDGARSGNVSSEGGRS